jgi:hypothetical protein
MTFLYFLEEMEGETVLQGVLRRSSLGRTTTFFNPKIVLFSFFFGKWKGREC